MANYTFKSIKNGPSLIEMAISMAYAFRMDNLHFVEFTLDIPGVDGYKEKVMITAIELTSEGRSLVEFKGRLCRRDGDISQKIEGEYYADTRRGVYSLIKSRLIVDVA